MQQSRLAFPIILFSVITAGVLAVQLLRERSRTHVLTIATGSKIGEYYAFSQAFAKVVVRHHPEIKLNVVETVGSLENLQQLEAGSAQLALVQRDTPIRYPVQAMAFLFPEMVHLIVRADANIQQVSDLRGKRILLPPQGSGSYKLFWPIVRHYGLDATTLDALALPDSQAYQAFSRGDGEALFKITALGNPAIRQLLRTRQARLLPIDQGDALQLSLPFVETTQIPKGTYNGALPKPNEDISALAVRAVLVAHESVDASLIHDLTRVLYDYRTELATEYPLAMAIALPESGEQLGLPLHAGAKAFYDQDRPNFVVEYAEPLGLLLSILVLCASGLWQIHLWLIGRQKNRADMYNLKLLELIEEIEQTQDFEKLAAFRQQLFDILREVVIDLDNDRISAKSFQSFTMPWETAMTTLRHRETILLKT